MVYDPHRVYSGECSILCVRSPTLLAGVNMSDKPLIKRRDFLKTAPLVVGGIVAMVLVYSDTNQNTRDISRHENLLSQQAENIQQILQDVAAIKAAVVR